MNEDHTFDAIRHASLRADNRWADVDLEGLEILADGTIELRRVPALASPNVHEASRARPSGIALDERCGLYVLDTAGHRLVRDALDCPERRILDGGDGTLGRFQDPTGVCVGPFGWVFVADPALGRVLVLSTPELSARDWWTNGLSRPIAVAPDDGRGIYVLDDDNGVIRLDVTGQPDAAFGVRVAGVLAAAQLRAIAAAPDGALYVADGAGAGVFRFTPSGAEAGSRLAPGTRPQALAVGGDILYLADEATGEIVLISLPSGEVLGALAGFRGPVSALAADAHGRVYVKPAADDAYLVAEPGAGRVARGVLTTSVPLDAGEDSVWLRAVVDVEIPSGSDATLDLSDNPPGVGPIWRRAAAVDTLTEPSRHLSLRVIVTGDGSERSPSIHQVRAETSGDSYLQYLPAVYSRDREGSDQLRRLLAMAKAELGDLEGEIALLARRFRIETAGVDDLQRLAHWLALPLPETLRPEDGAGGLRVLIDEVAELYSRRGTLGGIARAVDIYGGAQAVILEEFHTRGIWELDVAALDFDTRTASASVDGMVVGSSAVGESGPESAELWGSALFAPTAHRFSVVVPAAAAPADDDRRRIRECIEREKPAHTTYHLCFPDARLRIGLQARVGLDAIVAERGDELRLDEGARLDLNTWTAAAPDDAPIAAGQRGRIGIDALLG